MITQFAAPVYTHNHRDFSEPTPQDSYARKALAINHLKEAGFLINQQQAARIDASTPQQLKADLIAAGVLPVNPEAVLNYALTRAIEANNPSVTTLISLGANPLTQPPDGSHFMHAMCNQPQMTDFELARYLLYFFAQPGTYAFSMLFENSVGKPSPLQNACTRRPGFMETFHKMLVGDQDKDIAHKKTLLGLIYKHHEPRTLERLRLALSLFISAAGQKDKNAELELAKMYLDTKEQNPDMLSIAFKLLEEAAEAGLSEAYVVQANIYLQGTQSEQNMLNGLNLMKRAASQGHPLAEKTAIELAIKKGLVMLESTNNREDALTIAKAEFHYAANKKTLLGNLYWGSFLLSMPPVPVITLKDTNGYSWRLTTPTIQKKTRWSFKAGWPFF
jgi:TPR repeat protein